jgi:hypothetical protein
MERDRGSTRLSGRIRKPDHTLYIVLGAGAGLLILGVLIYAFSGSPRKEKVPPAPPAVTAEWLESEGRKAEQGGDRIKAYEYFARASDLYEQRGMSDKAQRLSMHAYDLQKFTPINVRK